MSLNNSQVLKNLETVVDQIINLQSQKINSLKQDQKDTNKKL